MRKIKTSKLIIVIATISLMFGITGCGSKTVSNTKTVKLTVTKENVQKVFGEQYNLSSIDVDWGNVSATFTTKKNVDRKEAIKLIKDIQLKSKNNFKATNPCDIKLNNIDNTLLGVSEDNKIFMGYGPEVTIEKQYATYKYSMATKFNLLNPSGDVKVTATDSEDGDITSKIKLENSEVLKKIGDQTLTYEVTDSDGNTGSQDLNIEITK